MDSTAPAREAPFGGSVYSLGASISTERAFGGLRTGTEAATFGVEFQNAAATAITPLAVFQIAATFAPLLPAAVPEPGSIGLLLAGSLVAPRRVKRQE